MSIEYLPRSEKLNIAGLQRLFDNKSESYKLFWFQALVDQVTGGRLEISYDVLINNMIAAAWYMVTEYHLNLGPSDNLEQAVIIARERTGLRANEKKERILEALETLEDREFRLLKYTLSQNVPYRLQAPFMPGMKGESWSGPKARVAAKINEYQDNIYRINIAAGLESTVTVDYAWADYICTNEEIIRGWLSFNMISYLQRRNPGVPGILNKLNPPDERKLTLVSSFWKGIISVTDIAEIYGGVSMSGEQVSIDHFIPWSYVSHDELWNLSPTTRSINSSKSNSLPDWGLYFEKLCRLEYRAFETAGKYPELGILFERCLDEYVNSREVRGKLFGGPLTLSQFSASLEEIMLPVYRSAKSMGYETWRMK